MDLTSYVLSKKYTDEKTSQNRFAEEFNLSTTYQKNNIVSYNGSSYMAKQTTVGNSPTGLPDDAYWGLISRKGADGTGTVHIHKETFIATEGQRVFTLQNTYDQFQNRTDVTVGGVPQSTPENYEETNSNTITLSEGVSSGTVVEIKYFSEAVPLQSDIQTVVDNHTLELSRKTTVFQQPEEPTNAVEGTLWLDTSDNTYQGTKFEDLESQLAQIATNITQFGASTSLTDNAPAIQAAIEYVSSNGGGTVLIPKGTFHVVGKVKTINVKSNVTLKGVGKESIIKIHNSTTSQWAYLFYHGDVLTENVGFENFTIDCNTSLPVTTSTHFVSSRVPFHLQGNGYVIKNMKIITNGIWGIHLKSSNSIIKDNEIVNDISACPTWFDQSLIWFGGENNTVVNNHVHCDNTTTFVPQTAIEFQGHRSVVENNILEGFKCGVIFTNSTAYLTDIYMLAEKGAKNNKIKNNVMNTIRYGIEIWTMSVTSDSIIKDNEIAGNNINLKNNLNSGTPASGIKFFLGNTAATGHDGDQLGSINGLDIHDNTIDFTLRTVNTHLSLGEHGVNVNVDYPISNLNFHHNRIKNCGGIGVLLHENTQDTLVHHIIGVKIRDNDFENVKLPIQISRNVSDLLIENNEFKQNGLYSTTADNMQHTIISANGTYTDNKNHKIKNNTILCDPTLKPFYPRFNMTIAESIYPSSRGMVLEQNTSETALLTEVPNGGTLIISQDKQVRRADGLFKATFTSGSTIGTLKASNGTSDVTIVNRLSNNTMEVSDATNIKPNQVLRIPFAYFNSGSCVVVSVVGNIVETGSGQLSLKAGVTNEFLGSVLSYYDSLTAVTETKSAFRAYQSTAQTGLTAANVFLRINFQTEEFDNLSEFDTTASRFTAKSLGLYQLSAGVRFDYATPSSNRITLSVMKNGTEYARLGDYTGGQIAGNTVVSLNAGDYIEIYASTQNTCGTFANNYSTYFGMARLS